AAGQGEEEPKKEAAGQGEEEPKKEAAGQGEEEPKKEDAGQGEEEPKKEAAGQGEEEPKKEAAGQGEEEPKKEAAGEGEEKPKKEAAGEGEEKPKKVAAGEGEEKPSEGARGYLGMTTLPISLPDRLAEKLGVECGLILLGVEPDGPADEGGLLLGDTILSLDDHPMRKTDDLRSRLGPGSVGKSLQAKVLRAGETKHLKLEVGAAPS
ncbi:MAG TPA: PDZ domain-containing protein, partial [Vulgatibacter sp.]|nr:PDZ domain-containing protein [Vulgatibacter sp.]